jgi:5-methylcytosine-specific restriction endonuclease McrA
MSGPANISNLDRLRLRDGGRCWLCDEPFDFSAKPNSPKSPTIEHLLSLSLGGTSRLENLALCHPRCNRILANRPIAEKVRLRDRRRKKRWIATLRSQ